jgi:hypothetical protein
MRGTLRMMTKPRSGAEGSWQKDTTVLARPSVALILKFRAASAGKKHNLDAKPR